MGVSSLRKSKRRVALLGSAFLVCVLLVMIAFLARRDDPPVAATGRVFGLDGESINAEQQSVFGVGGGVELSYGGTYPTSCSPPLGRGQPCSYETWTQYK